MANNIAVRVTADVADLTAKMAVARADLTLTTKALNDLAKQSQATGMTTELKASLLAAGDAAAKAKNTVSLYSNELRKLAPALDGVTHASAGVTREVLVMGRELARGNFNRMAGSATILAGRLGILTPAVLGTAAVVAAIVAPLAAFAVAAEQGADELGKFQGAMEATNGYAGVTISQLQNMSRTMAAFAHDSIGTATESLMSLAASGKFSGQTLLLVGEDAAKMGQLTGENADKFIEQFEKMGEGVSKFALEYQNKYHQLTLAQYEYIRQLEEQGDKEGAERALAQDVYNYLGQQAPQQLGYLERAWHSLRDAVSEAWDEMKAVGRNSNQDQLDTLNSQLDNMKRFAAEQRANGATPSAGDQKAIANLEAQKRGIEGREAAEQRSASARSAAARAQTDGINAAAQLGKQFEDSRSSGEKLHKTIRDINTELAKAVAADPGSGGEIRRRCKGRRPQGCWRRKPDGRHGGRASPVRIRNEKPDRRLAKGHAGLRGTVLAGQAGCRQKGFRALRQHPCQGAGGAACRGRQGRPATAPDGGQRHQHHPVGAEV